MGICEPAFQKDAAWRVLLTEGDGDEVGVFDVRVGILYSESGCEPLKDKEKQILNLKIIGDRSETYRNLFPKKKFSFYSFHTFFAERKEKTHTIILLRQPFIELKKMFIGQVLKFLNEIIDPLISMTYYSCWHYSIFLKLANFTFKYILCG